MGKNHYIPKVNYQGSLSTMKGVHCPQILGKYMNCTEFNIKIGINNNLRNA